MAAFKEGTGSEVVDFVAEVTGLSAAEAEGLFGKLTGSFLTHQEPRTEFHTRLITLGPAGNCGVSRKPSNFYLNWRRLLDPALDVGMAAWAAEGPYRTSVVALYIWNKVRNAVTVEVPPAAGVVIEALWLGKGDRVTIARSRVPDLLERHYERCSIPALNQVEVDAALDWLGRFGCIEIKDDKIWLREWVERRI